MAPEPSDLLGAWERVLRELRGAAGASGSEVARAMGGLVTRQGELLQDLLDRQGRLEQQVLGRALAPVNAAMDLLEQTSTAMRAQAKALDAAATS